MEKKIDVLAVMGRIDSAPLSETERGQMAAARELVVDLILAAERVARRAKNIAHNHAPGSLGEQEADALIAALDRMRSS